MLQVSDIGHRYGSHQALAGVTFTVGEGELVCIVGPSGCGKSTLLRAIAGLQKPSTGTVTLAGTAVAGTPPPGLAVVFQDYSRSLFPWRTVLGNVVFPLRSLSRAERRERAHSALEAVGLANTAAKYPWQLSGGMQQRVAIARALAYQPSLMLMDEPFASVDAQTRADLEDLLLRVRRERGTTVLLVTHDIDESVYLGDRVLVLSTAPGTVVRDIEVGLPADRDQITTRASEEFVRLRAETAKLLRH